MRIRPWANPTTTPIGERPMARLFLILYAVCPGGEGAVLKTVGCKRLAGSNPVHGAKLNIWV